MRRTSIMAEEATLERLRALAVDRGVPLATVVREALEEKATEYRPRPASLGSGSSKLSRTGAGKGSSRVPPRSWR